MPSPPLPSEGPSGSSSSHGPPGLSLPTGLQDRPAKEKPIERTVRLGDVEVVAESDDAESSDSEAELVIYNKKWEDRKAPPQFRNKIFADKHKPIPEMLKPVRYNPNINPGKSILWMSEDDESAMIKWLQDPTGDLSSGRVRDGQRYPALIDRRSILWDMPRDPSPEDWALWTNEHKDYYEYNPHVCSASKMMAMLCRHGYPNDARDEQFVHPIIRDENDFCSLYQIVWASNRMSAHGRRGPRDPAPLTGKIVAMIIQHNNKSRFEMHFLEDHPFGIPAVPLTGWFIRAVQGHSVPDGVSAIRMPTPQPHHMGKTFPRIKDDDAILVSGKWQGRHQLFDCGPVKYVFHGTDLQSAKAILFDDLRIIPGGPRHKRQAIHLGTHFTDKQETLTAGFKTKAAVWLFINLQALVEHGYPMYLNPNGVILTDQSIPVRFIVFAIDRRRQRDLLDPYTDGIDKGTFAYACFTAYRKRMTGFVMQPQEDPEHPVMGTYDDSRHSPVSVKSSSPAAQSVPDWGGCDTPSPGDDDDEEPEVGNRQPFASVLAKSFDCDTAKKRMATVTTRTSNDQRERRPSPMGTRDFKEMLPPLYQDLINAHLNGDVEREEELLREFGDLQEAADSSTPLALGDSVVSEPGEKELREEVKRIKRDMPQDIWAISEAKAKYLASHNIDDGYNSRSVPHQGRSRQEAGMFFRDTPHGKDFSQRPILTLGTIHENGWEKPDWDSIPRLGSPDDPPGTVQGLATAHNYKLRLTPGQWQYIRSGSGDQAKKDRKKLYEWFASAMPGADQRYNIKFNMDFPLRSGTGINVLSVNAGNITRPSKDDRGKPITQQWPVLMSLFTHSSHNIALVQEAAGLYENRQVLADEEKIVSGFNKDATLGVLVRGWVSKGTSVEVLVDNTDTQDIHFMIAEVTWGRLLASQASWKKNEHSGDVKRASMRTVRVCVCHVDHKKAVSAVCCFGLFRMWQACIDHQVDFASLDGNRSAYRIFQKQESINLQINTIRMTLEGIQTSFNKDQPYWQRLGITVIDNNTNEEAFFQDKKDLSYDDFHKVDCCVLAIFSYGQTEHGRWHRHVMKTLCSPTDAHYEAICNWNYHYALHWFRRNMDGMDKDDPMVFAERWAKAHSSSLPPDHAPIDWYIQPNTNLMKMTNQDFCLGPKDADSHKPIFVYIKDIDVHNPFQGATSDRTLDQEYDEISKGERRGKFFYRTLKTDARARQCAVSEMGKETQIVEPKGMEEHILEGRDLAGHHRAVSQRVRVHAPSQASAPSGSRARDPSRDRPTPPAPPANPAPPTKAVPVLPPPPPKPAPQGLYQSQQQEQWNMATDRMGHGFSVPAPPPPPPKPLSPAPPFKAAPAHLTAAPRVTLTANPSSQQGSSRRSKSRPRTPQRTGSCEQEAIRAGASIVSSDGRHDRPINAPDAPMATRTVRLVSRSRSPSDRGRRDRPVSQRVFEQLEESVRLTPASNDSLPKPPRLKRKITLEDEQSYQTHARSEDLLIERREFLLEMQNRDLARTQTRTALAEINRATKRGHSPRPTVTEHCWTTGGESSDVEISYPRNFPGRKALIARAGHEGAIEQAMAKHWERDADLAVTRGETQAMDVFNEESDDETQLLVATLDERGEEVHVPERAVHHEDPIPLSGTLRKVVYFATPKGRAEVSATRIQLRASKGYNPKVEPAPGSLEEFERCTLLTQQKGPSQSARGFRLQDTAPDDVSSAELQRLFNEQADIDAMQQSSASSSASWRPGEKVLPARLQLRERSPRIQAPGTGDERHREAVAHGAISQYFKEKMKAHKKDEHCSVSYDNKRRYVKVQPAAASIRTYIPQQGTTSHYNDRWYHGPNVQVEMPEEDMSLKPPAFSVRKTTTGVRLVPNSRVPRSDGLRPLDGTSILATRVSRGAPDHYNPEDCDVSTDIDLPEYGNRYQ